MNNEESCAPAVKKSTSWDWLWPTIAAVVIVKFFGLVGGFVTFGVYYWLKPKLGPWSAVAIAGGIGVVAAIALGAMLRTFRDTELQRHSAQPRAEAISQPESSLSRPICKNYFDQFEGFKCVPAARVSGPDTTPQEVKRSGAPASPPEADLDAEEKRLQQRHPQWKAIVTSTAFTSWLLTRSPEYQQACRTTNSVDTLAGCIDDLFASTILQVK